MNIEKAVKMNRLAASGAGNEVFKLPRRDDAEVGWDEELNIGGEPCAIPAQDLAPNTYVLQGNSIGGDGTAGDARIMHSLESASAEEPEKIKYPDLRQFEEQLPPPDPAVGLLERLEAAERMYPQDMKGKGRHA